MTCAQLGGACQVEFQADTFEEMARLSQEHGMEMMQQGDPAHLEAMKAMGLLMQDPGKMQQWMDEKHQEFNSLPES